VKTKYLSYLSLLNIAGLILSILYGIYGGSGGETTEGVFLGISLTGIITIFGAILFTFSFELFKKRWYWILILIIVGSLELMLYNWA